MFPKTFLSYKYSEARGLRDTISRILGDAYYGEKPDSPDLSSSSPCYISNYLQRLINPSEVVVVVVSPCMSESRWIEWELIFALSGGMHDGHHKPKGIVGVIINGFERRLEESLRTNRGNTWLTRSIIDNRYNRIIQGSPQHRGCSYNEFEDSYISLVSERNFLSDPSHYLCNAMKKAERAQDYELTFSRHLLEKLSK